MKALLLSLFLLLTTFSILDAQELRIDSVDFGKVTCGTQRCRQIVLTNTGTSALSIENISLPSGAFTIQPSSFSLPILISGGKSSSITACYSSLRPFQRDSASLLCKLSGGKQIQKTLLAESIAPALSFSQAFYRFGTVLLGRKDTIQLKVYNPGNDTLILPPAQSLAPPFSIGTFSAQRLPPHDSAFFTISFSPVTEGVAQDTAIFNFSSCFPPVQLPLAGYGAPPAANDLGGVLQSIPSPVDFDTTLCGSTKCMMVRIKNIGSAVARILGMDGTIASPFSISAVQNTTLQPDSSTSVTICYTPQGTDSVDHVSLRLRVDTRQSLNIGLLFDASSSMSETVGPNDQAKRIEAAKEAGKNFITQLIYDLPRSVIDTAAVFAFNDKGVPEETFTVLEDFTTQQAKLKKAIDFLDPKNSTCLYFSVIEAVKLLSKRTNPTLILLSDGEDSCSFTKLPLQDAINAAKAANIRVFVIAIADTAETADTNRTRYIGIMKKLGSETGGQAFFARSTSEISNAYKTIAQQLSQNVTLYIPLLGNGTAPAVQISPSPLNFDSVRIRQRKCLPVTIWNKGAAPLFITPAQLVINSPDFAIDTTALPSAFVRPQDSATFSVCFTPTRLRLQKAEGLQTFSSCASSAQFRVQGVGYDSLTLTLDNTIIGKPNEKIEVPIYLSDTLSLAYGVDSLQFTVDYHSTLLDTLSPLINSATGSALSMNGNVSAQTAFRGDTMSVSYMLKGRSLVQATPQSELLRLPYTVLNASVMQSEFHIRSVQFADGNPRVGVVQPAIVQLDSSCFQNARLLDTRKRRGVTITALQLHPGRNADLSFTLDEASDVQLSVYTMLGNLVQSINYSALQKGMHQYVFILAPLPASAYIVEVRSGAERDSRLIVAGE